MDIFDRLKQAAAPEWDSYVNHEFVRQLGDGTLHESAFRTYRICCKLFGNSVRRTPPARSGGARCSKAAISIAR